MNDLVVVGSPTGERARAYADSLGGDSYRTISWWEVLAGRPLRLSEGTLLRCESPSDDLLLDAELIRLGGGDPTGHADGRLIDSRHWYAGLGVLLGRLDELLLDEVPVARMQSTASMLAMFDKAHTDEVLRQAGVPVPPPTDPDADGQHFVKARHGSSGAGLVALRRAGGRLAVHSTVALTDRGAFNSVRAQTYHTEAELQQILAAIGPVVCQRWLPKTTLDGGPCDFRVVVIAGRARQVLARIGSGPFTNLHLGARRGDVTRLRTRLGQAWELITDTAEAAAACFDEAHYCGVDVLLTPNREAYVLEVNAFGDFHEGVFVDGLDTYQTELVAWEAW